MVDGPVTVGDLRAEYVPGRALGIGAASPRLSWITTTERAGWMQAGYEIELDGVALGRVDGDESVFVPWPGRTAHLPRRAPRARAGVGSRRVGVDVERAARHRGRSPVARRLVGALDHLGRRGIRRRARASRSTSGASSRFAPGRCDDRARPPVRDLGRHQPAAPERCRWSATRVLAPGWSTYDQRLRYETHDVTALVAPGENVIGAVVADGWWRGYLGWEMMRERLRRPARPARAARDHVLRRHRRDDRHRRDVADLVRSRS